MYYVKMCDNAPINEYTSVREILDDFMQTAQDDELDNELTNFLDKKYGRPQLPYYYNISLYEILQMIDEHEENCGGLNIDAVEQAEMEYVKEKTTEIRKTLNDDPDAVVTIGNGFYIAKKKKNLDF